MEIGGVSSRIRGDADLVAGLVPGLASADATVLVLMGANEPALTDVDLRMSGLPDHITGLQVGDLGPVMTFEPGLLQYGRLAGRVERVGADVQSRVLQRVVHQARTVIVRIAVTIRLVVPVGIVIRDPFRPRYP